jgi:myo-inositol-1(or 4)-monophosphatase
MTELEIAQKAARAGGEIVRRYYRDGVEIRTNNESYNLVTDADVESEQAIVGTIRDAFPDHGMLAEEAHRDDPGVRHLWVIDPLDGTSNFAHGVPYFAVSIAYFVDGRPRCSVVYNPVLEDCYVAALGQGAYYNGKPVRVASHRSLDESLIAVGFYYPRGAMMQATLSAIGDLFGRRIHGIRRFGSAALDLCNVGTGALGAFFEFELSPWDFAAGRLFVEEAGGRATTCYGTPLPLTQSSVLATNGILHEPMLGVIREHLPASGTRDGNP